MGLQSLKSFCATNMRSSIARTKMYIINCICQHNHWYGYYAEQTICVQHQLK